MIESLGYRKVCARWVPRLLTEDHKGQRKAITSELLQRYPSDYHLFGFVKDQLRGQRRQFRKQCVSVFGWLERNFTEGEFSNSQNAGKNVYK
jgi:hypothetical protein